ncbi:hypothetical protein S40293_01034 [Stachybotrys chartarum IBT 40293]|nr:hypothetical protein S40293_01034 [Stachybotrys chartarum IBT 40293]
MQPTVLLPLLFALASAESCSSKIDRQKIIQTFNPRRNASYNTPLQVGNGNFAFGADITGLQTFNHFATMSTWGWHNFSLPTTPGQTSIADYTGTEWWTHGRLVRYNMVNDNNTDIGNWLRENPHRINLGTIGLFFVEGNVTEEALSDKVQELDLWTGMIESTFLYRGSRVTVKTVSSPDSDTLGISLESELLTSGKLGLFFDFPYPVNAKFDEPFVGAFNQTDKHKTSFTTGKNWAIIHHDLNTMEYDFTVRWTGNGEISAVKDGSHRYALTLEDSKVDLSAEWAPVSRSRLPTYEKILQSSQVWWKSYWGKGAFVNLIKTDSADAWELQRRTILSQYLLAVNSASDYPPQESGLVNNGWYGKFHMEMIFWHHVQFARWGHWDLLRRALPQTWTRLLPGALERATDQGYTGARWGKMTDPSTIDSPGEINTLLIWQQPHPMYFAELEYREFPTNDTLDRWAELLDASAEWLASYAYFNQSTGVYDLGPPMYPSSENTNPNTTRNPTFELAYWRFGLDIASEWRTRMGREVPETWKIVKENLAPIPIDTASDTYPIYEGIPDMWIDPETVFDHPSMTGIYGVLPPPRSGEPFNHTLLDNTAAKVWETWDLDAGYGWDFPMLAMNALRLGDVDRAVEYILHSSFQFDDAGYPIGGSRVPTPYFPSSGGLLMTVAMMAGGWDGKEGLHFPPSWTAVAEHFTVGL